MKKYIIFLILFYCIQSRAQIWNLVWGDEFDGTIINKTNWNVEKVYYNGGGGELEYYLPQNVIVSGGFLTIVAKKENYGWAAYTSGRLNTQGKQSFKYGKFEARIKIPMGQGLWPAFWMLGNSLSSAGWPKCGEIDILEHINSANYVVGTMHWDKNGHVQDGASAPFSNPLQFHVYSIEWDANSIKWFIDGKRFYTGNIANNINSTEELHEPAFFILNLAVGGNWPGSPDSSTPFPDTMFVDYIRVYTASPTIVSDVNPIPAVFSLSQNYPNPFNPTTTICYSIEKPEFVNLKVYDVLGKEVTTLVNQEQPKGFYKIDFDAALLPGGAYFYRLQSGNFIVTKKLILLR